MKPRWSEFRNPFGLPGVAPASVTRMARVGLDLLVVFNVVAQAVFVMILLMGRGARGVLPVAAGAIVSLSMLLLFYARWMFPFLKTRHLLMVIVFKEAGVIVLLGFSVGVVMFLQWLF